MREKDFAAPHTLDMQAKIFPQHSNWDEM